MPCDSTRFLRAGIFNKVEMPREALGLLRTSEQDLQLSDNLSKIAGAHYLENDGETNFCGMIYTAFVQACFQTNVLF